MPRFSPQCMSYYDNFFQRPQYPTEGHEFVDLSFVAWPISTLLGRGKRYVCWGRGVGGVVGVKMVPTLVCSAEQHFIAALVRMNRNHWSLTSGIPQTSVDT